MANTALWQSVSRKCKGAQRRGDLSVKDDLVEGFGHGELLAAQIVRSVCPVADGAVIAAAAAAASRSVCLAECRSR